ncbi:immunity protein 51 of polymorphic toxin system [Collimonas sp. PA-H2]|uniref:Imm51 family immunity protein n=1 Tax=Collimonas sp. PA-H2 TaxID=1881062 RepID=UPI000BF2BD7F|nr:Imm51 family immunity protein [Collimonas sp. PA-H2]PFH10995.1 immunity protein 51 of polymorphic toxin system [Collimonas sp. PA-H2]
MKFDSMTMAAEGPVAADVPQDGNASIDMTTFAPFFLIDGSCKALVLFEVNFREKAYIFKERAEEGWTGNGLDWNSVAQLVIAERLPKLADQFKYDSNVGFFYVSGTIASLTLLGYTLKIAFDDDHVLRDILFRAKLHDSGRGGATENLGSTSAQLR